MKRRQMSAILMLVVLTVISITGCSAKEQKALSNAIQVANSAKSVETETKVDMAGVVEAEGQKQDMSMTYTMNMSQFTEPLKTKGTVKMSVSGMSMEFDMYMLEENGNFVSYMNMEQLGGWMKQTLCSTSDMEEANQRSMQMNAKLFASESFSYERKDDITEDGKTYYVYDAVLKKEQMKEVLGSVQSFYDSTGMGIDEEIEKIAADMPDIPFTVWIDSEEEVLYRVKFSMGEVLRKIVESMGADETEAMEISKLDMDIIYKNYDKVENFELPAEAKDAQDITELQEQLDSESEE